MVIMKRKSKFELIISYSKRIFSLGEGEGYMDLVVTKENKTTGVKV